MVILINVLLALRVLFALGFFLILAYIAFIMISFRKIVPYVPTPKRIIRIMIELAGIRDGERICDLGSGGGRIIFKVAKTHKQNLVFGIENSPTLRIVSRFFLLFHPLIKKRIQIIKQDFYNMDLTQFDVIFCFLTPNGLRILEPQFQTLKAKSRIVSYMFPLENHQNFSEYIEQVSVKDSIYVYKKL